MKTLWIALLFLIGAGTARAQVKFELGATYANGTVEAVMISPGGLPALHISYLLDGSGNGILSNLSQGADWRIITCQPTGAVCLTTVVIPTGLVQDLTTALNSSGGAVPVVTVNPATCTTGQTFFNTATSQFLLCIATNTISTASGAPATTIDSKLFGVSWDGRSCVNHVTWLNSSSTITTDSSCPFTAADTGKKAFGSPCNTPTGCETVGATLPIGTITFVSATSATTTATTTAACASNCQAWIFTDDRAKWCCGAGTVDNALQTANGCPTLLLSQGGSPIPFGFGNTPSPNCMPGNGAPGNAGTQAGNTDAGSYIFGLGIGTSVFILPPDDNFASCTGTNGSPIGNGCILGGFTGGSNFTVTGGGNGLTGTHNACLWCPSTTAAYWHDITLTEFGNGDLGNLVGFGVPFANKIDAIYVDGFGGGSGAAGAACELNGSLVVLTNSFCGDVKGLPFLVAGTSTIARTYQVEIGATLGTIQATANGSGIIWDSSSDQSFGSVGSGGVAVFAQNGARITLSNYRSTNSAVSKAVQTDSTSTIVALNSSLLSATTGITNAGTFIDECGNTVTGTTKYTGAGTIVNCPSEPSVGGRCLLTSAASPLACVAASNGKVAIPASQATYTINTTAVASGSTITITPTTDNTGIPGAPACTLPTNTAIPSVSATVAGTSFTIAETSTASITCYEWSIR